MVSYSKVAGGSMRGARHSFYPTHGSIDEDVCGSCFELVFLVDPRLFRKFTKISRNRFFLVTLYLSFMASKKLIYVGKETKVDRGGCAIFL